jgi:hypothetical protein
VSPLNNTKANPKLVLNFVDKKPEQQKNINQLNDIMMQVKSQTLPLETVKHTIPSETFNRLV